MDRSGDRREVYSVEDALTDGHQGKEKTSERKNGNMKIAGIVMVVFQALAVVGGFAIGHSVIDNVAGKSALGAVTYLIGYFLIGIIGIILIIKGSKKEEEKTGGTEPRPVGGAAGKTLFCPKCGSEIQAGDAFCMNCGSAIKK